MRVLASGNVGIGTTDPGDFKLNVAGNAKLAGNMTIGRSGGHYDEIGYNVGFTSTEDTYTYVVPNTAASIRLANLGGIEFRTAAFGAAGTPLVLNQRMIITQGGNVGIGRMQPFAALHLAREHDGPFDTGAGGQASIIVENIDAAANGGPSAVRLMRNGATRWAWVNDVDGNAADGLTLWQQGALKRMTVDTSGNVGIGTANPSQKLEVTGRILASKPSNLGRGLFLKSDVDPTHFSWQIAAQDHVDGGLEFTPSTTAGGAAFSTPAVVIMQSGNVGIGTATPSAKLEVNGSLKVTGVGNSVTTPVLTVTGGADVAEPFLMSEEDIPKGAVVVIDEENPGQLKLSESAYDRRVAGIVSGAGGVQPGITLSQQGVLEGGQQVALSGRVYVQADATHGPIKPGDMLTTSATPGHAMKVSDHAQAQGAILGKAMSRLESGKGLVLVLVTLQ